MRLLPRRPHTAGMTGSPPCEYVDVALYLQQLSRGREGAGSTDAGAGGPCGQPSVAASRTTAGVVEHVCALHLHQPNLVRG